MATIAIGPGSPVDIQVTRQHVQAELAAMPTIGIGQVLFGVKLVIDLICGLSGAYGRHRSNVVTQLPPTVVGALDVLFASCDVLININPPGPR